MINFDPRTIVNNNRILVHEDVLRLKEWWVNPHLSVLLIGENESAKVYARVKVRIWESLWVKVTVSRFNDKSTQSEIIDKILQQNNDQTVHWILIESPIPNHMSYDHLINKVDQLKDVDGLSIANLWKILSKDSDWILPATPLACISILEWLTDKFEWLKIVIVWHWKTVWGPLSNMLSNMWATGTSCNHHTRNLWAECKNADVIITATWVPGLIKDDFVKENTIVIDAWISVNEEWVVVWDVDYNNVSKVAQYVTPVPGWVWPITTSIIFNNLIKAIKLQKKKYDPFWISVNDFISLSKSSWMPGWWGIASMTAINAVSMISMVYSLTKWTKKDIYEPKIDIMLYELKQLYLEDIAWFSSYLKAIKLPKITQEEKIYRADALEQASIGSSLVPIKIARLCIEILNMAKSCYRIWNKDALSDVIVWVNLAIAAAKSALEPVEMNLSNITDENLKVNLMKEKGDILSKINHFSLQE